MPEAFVDPYIDPETGVLRNLVGARTYDDLRNAEGELVSARTVDYLRAGDLHVDGSLKDFCRIHKSLFRDVYDWAGLPRTIEIRKNVEGSEFFLPSINIPTGFDWAMGELKKDRMLVGLARDEFVRRLAYHFDNYNFIHPFREGNGRTQRLFWTLLCHGAGYDLDWRQVSGADNDEASRLAAEEKDYSGLIGIFDCISSPCDPRASIRLDEANLGHLG